MYTSTVLERFLRYVKIDTQSDASSQTQPSTAKQKDLSRVLVSELLAMGIADAEMDEHGLVYATIPATTDKKNVPVICFCSHVDTSPDCSGKDVKPIVHANYQGENIQLPLSPMPVLSPNDHPELLNQLGNDIITASGDTLLGADNKAGLAEIIDAAYYLMQNPSIKHGKIRLLFTPDEEIGRGVDKVDMARLGANFGYTIDGETLGHLENETFSADYAVVEIDGVSTHPGFAKNKMESAIKIACDIVAALPKQQLSPETTDGMQPFVHPLAINGTIEAAKVQFILRAFDVPTLHREAQILQSVVDVVMLNYPNSKAKMTVSEQYRNMKEVLDQHPKVIDYAVKAIQKAGITPHLSSIRGGTDGSRLSFMGLPCPNVFAGEHAFHSRLEWISVQDMQHAVNVIVNIAQLWEEGA